MLTEVRCGQSECWCGVSRWGTKGRGRDAQREAKGREDVASAEVRYAIKLSGQAVEHAHYTQRFSCKND